MVKRTIRRDVPMAKSRNDFTAPNMSIEKPHKAVPIPHPTPRNRLFTPPKKQNKIKMACLVRWSEVWETGRLEENDLHSLFSLSPSLVSCPYPHSPGLEKCSAVPVKLDFLRVDRLIHVWLGLISLVNICRDRMKRVYTERSEIVSCLPCTVSIRLAGVTSPK